MNEPADIRGGSVVMTGRVDVLASILTDDTGIHSVLIISRDSTQPPIILDHDQANTLYHALGQKINGHQRPNFSVITSN